MKKYQFDTSSCAAAWKVIMHARRITLLAHLRPDADSLGACGALASMLSTHEKQVEIIYPHSHAEPLPFPLKNLSPGTHTQTPDLIICCDISTDERAYTCPDFSGVPRIIIDHHRNNVMDGIHRFVTTEASSTCEIVATLLETWKQHIDTDIAEMLLFGILCDTQSFVTPNTSPETLRIASRLIESGANLAHLNSKRVTHRDPTVLKLWGQLLSSIHYLPDQSAVWAICTKELFASFELDERALSGFINTLSQTIMADVTMLFCEVDDGVKVSLRGKTRDVRRIAAQFGGGGHTLAAGITTDLSLQDIVKQVTQLL